MMPAASDDRWSASRRRSLRLRSLLLREFVLFSGLPVVLISALILAFLYRERMRAQRQFAVQQAAAGAARIEQAMERQTAELLNLMRAPKVRTALASPIEAQRKQAASMVAALVETAARNRLSYLVGFHLLDAGGAPVVKWGRSFGPEGPGGATTDYFVGALHLAAIRGQRAPVHKSHSGGDQPVIYSTLVSDEDGGILGVAVFAADFRPLFREMSMSGACRLTGLLDSYGSPIAEALLGRTALGFVGGARSAALYEVAGIIKEEGWPLDQIVAYARVRPPEQSSIRWTAFFQVPAGSLVAYYKAAAWAVGGAGVVVLLLAVAIAHWLSSGIARPIVQLVEAAERLREGDWEAPLPAVTRPKEIAMLTESFRRTRDEIRQSQRELKAKIAAVEASEAALAVEKERLAVILRGITDAVIAVDVDGRVHFANRAAENLLGLPNDRIVAHMVSEKVHANDPQNGKPLDLMRAAVSSASPRPTDVKIVREDRREVLCELLAAPVANPAGQQIGTIFTLKDVTMERQAAAERMRNERIRSLGVLAGGIAHDFNNLLAVIMGNGSLLQDLPRDRFEDVPLIAHEIVDAAERARALSNQLLVFAKGGSPVKREAPLRAIVEEALAFATRGSACTYRVEAPNDLRVVVADPDQLHQVFHNLALNAVQAMPAGGEIHVRLENFDARDSGAALGLKPGPCVRVRFRDFGCGIPPDNLPHIFEPYFTTKPQGQGLGLSTVHGILAAHGGAITVHPCNPGTEFEIIIPASTESAQARSAAGDSAPSATPRLRVLVLEDDATVANMTRKMLEHLGHSVTMTSDGATCVRAYEEAASKGAPFDLTIMDLTIRGGMGGLDAVRILRRNHPNLRAIACSGYAKGGAMSNATEYGFSAVLPKPFTLMNLRAAIAAVLEREKGKA